MTLLEIEILAHYRCRTTDYRDGDFSAPAVREAIDNFRNRDGLLEIDNYKTTRSAYRITERGRVYLDALQALPLPIQKWVMPTSEEKQS